MTSPALHTLVLGFDAFDPEVFERMAEQGRLPALRRMAAADGYRRFGVACPPQSEVSWTSIATGADPGVHGMFDFVHRDPETYGLSVSLLPTESGLGGTRFVRPHNARTVFDEVVEQGYPATSLWWPATFPARPESPVRTIPGLGTPDVRGQLGVGTLCAADTAALDPDMKTRVVALEDRGSGRFEADFPGPARATRRGERPSTLELTLECRGEDEARLVVGDEVLDLAVGEWSPVLDLEFKLGWFAKVRALSRAIVTQTGARPRVYLLPLQLHPIHAPWRYGSPGGFVRELWSTYGPFLTLGWPQDTTALEEDCITDAQFLELCDYVFACRRRVLLGLLDRFDEGLLACVFDSLDRVQHMFRRDRPEVVEQWYERLDGLVAEVEAVQAGRDAVPELVVVSDHGFTDFDYKVHLNRWLMDKGYLVADGAEDGDLELAEWGRTRAYALGLNGLYLNRAGREAEGCVAPGDVAALMAEVRAALLDWTGPDGRSVVASALPAGEAFHGPLADHGPDLVVGYAPGYRASQATGLGGWEATAVERNEDHWGADHCVDAASVSGVVFSSRGLNGLERPSFRDFPALVADVEVVADGAPPPKSSPEERERVEERLKGLGYL